MAEQIQRVQVNDLEVAQVLYDFVNQEVLPGTNISPEVFWSRFSEIIHDLAPENRQLLKKREELQTAINQWHYEHPGPVDPQAYKAFLTFIGYLVEEGEDFKVGTSNVDSEIAQVAGPQLVVPITNARYAVNAANARWGSLYDALYGTDALGHAPQGNDFHPIPGTKVDAAHGAKVIAEARNRLDGIVPLAKGSHRDVTQYRIEEGNLVITLKDGTRTKLAQPEKFAGFFGSHDQPSVVLLINNGLHAEIQIDRNHPIGKTDLAGVADVKLEAALTTIMDFEDSVATVDANDKVAAYRNWMGLMKGDLIGDFDRAGEAVTRRLDPDRHYITPGGYMKTLPGRSLMMVRNVGHLMMDDSILDKEGNPTPEGIMDLMITSAIALHDLKEHRNSREGSIYIVKPKMHGPEEVGFADKSFARVEDALDLPRNTLKMGIMDEERRTTLNLSACIHAAKDRVAFINTGFLDRTGDEIHTSMHAGAMLPKGQMRTAQWMTSYEDWNVDTGLACGLPGHAQIGKGMWARPEDMAEMLAIKIGHPKAGANTAWVPSPTAATLHALHYHLVNVAEQQAKIAAGGPRATLDDILTIPHLSAAERAALTPEMILREIDNNTQSILGYVVRWVDLGVGCSKVPDINDVKLMEDRATLRISSQILANWLHHGICTPGQVQESLKKMAVKVDAQNANEAGYHPMAPNFNGPAFQAASDLIFKGVDQPSGYTEPLLYEKRREVKQAARLTA